MKEHIKEQISKMSEPTSTEQEIDFHEFSNGMQIEFLL
jgi:hypothetical protein